MKLIAHMTYGYNGPAKSFSQSYVISSSREEIDVKGVRTEVDYAYSYLERELSSMAEKQLNDSEMILLSNVISFSFQFI